MRTIIDTIITPVQTREPSRLVHRGLKVREVEYVRVAMPKPLALSVLRAVERHAEGQCDGEVSLDHPDVDSDDLMKLAEELTPFVRGLR